MYHAAVNRMDAREATLRCCERVEHYSHFRRTIGLFVQKLKIKNFKGFGANFEIAFDAGMNIIVGSNEVGKSTILDAINVALTGMLGSRYLRNELSTYLFNKAAEQAYLESVRAGKPISPPEIVIEAYLDGDKALLAELEGDANSEKAKASGVSYKIFFDEQYAPEYAELIKRKEITSIPIEYYRTSWRSFARAEITGRSIPLKSAVIDASQHRLQSGSDVFISRIVREGLDDKERVSISQAHRLMRDGFQKNDGIAALNERIQKAARITNKSVKISVDLATQNAWEQSLMTYVDDIPFHHIGKGEQCVIKTKLALSHKRAAESTVLLIEEPENHLAHARLAHLVADIQKEHGNKQVIVTTHSSFVANKLGLDKLILLRNQKTARIKELESADFFKKLAGYDTLRLVLAKKCILVEGDSDELIVQRAYMDAHEGRLPIEDDIDVVSVGTSFLRFLEIAQILGIPTAVVTDNDGDIDALKKKYEDYEAVQGLKICFDTEVDTGDLSISGKPYNYNTLEPKLLKANDRAALNEVFGTAHASDDDLRKYMQGHKTECALAIFSSGQSVKMPDYIVGAIQI